MSEKLPRDVFIDEIYNFAKKDRNIYFLSADLGAKALDKFREELKEQFIHTGISEQAMINFASGLALSGKKVYCYAMAPFVTFRPFEQIKVSLASMNQPVTLLGIGVGYGYDSAGPTHYATEDIGVMRSLGNIEILSPSDTKSVIEAAKLTYEKPYLRYIRLDRKFLNTIYPENDNSFVYDGIKEIYNGKDIAIISTGYMTHIAIEAREKLIEDKIILGIIDVFRIKPFNEKKLLEIIKNYKKLIILEEHFLSAGLGSIIAEVFMDNNFFMPTLRLGIKDKYYFENNITHGREYIHKLVGINTESIIVKIKNFLRNEK